MRFVAFLQLGLLVWKSKVRILPLSLTVCLFGDVVTDISMTASARDFSWSAELRHQAQNELTKCRGAKIAPFVSGKWLRVACDDFDSQNHRSRGPLTRLPLASIRTAVLGCRRLVMLHIRFCVIGESSEQAIN